MSFSVRHLIVKEGEDYRMVSMRDLVLRKPATGEDDEILLPDDHLRVRDITSFPMPRSFPARRHMSDIMTFPPIVIARLR